MNVNEFQVYLTPESEKENDLIEEMISSITTKGFDVYWGDVEYPDDGNYNDHCGYKMSIEEYEMEEEYNPQPYWREKDSDRISTPSNQKSGE